MSNGKTVNNDGPIMHIDLRLVPLKKQVNLIWLSRVVKNSAELQEKTGLNEFYIKYILQNKSIILKNWRETIQNAKKVNPNEEYDHDGIDILLLEWVRCCTINKIVLYRYAIEMQANNLKDFFESPKYRIKEKIWQDINTIKEYNTEYVTAAEHIPCDLYTIFKTTGNKILKLQTYMRFSIIMKRKVNTDCIKLLKKTHFEKQNSNDNSSEQFDDLILIENPIECIDVTAEDEIFKNEPLSPRSNTERSNQTVTTFSTGETFYDFPTTFDPRTSIKKEPCENMEAETIMEFQQVQIKNEILEDDTIANGATEHVESIQFNSNVNGLSEEVNDIKTDMDIGEEFIQLTDTKSTENSNSVIGEIQTFIKTELENEDDNAESAKRSQITANCIKNAETDNGNRRVYNVKKNKVSLTNKIIDNNSGISNNVNTNIKSVSIFKDGNDSDILLTTNIKSETDTPENNVELVEKVSDLKKNNNNENVNNSIIPTETTEFINGDNIDEDNSEIEVVYEIEDSDEEMQSELQQIINNYRKTETSKEKEKENLEEQQKQQQLDYEGNEEETITVLEVMSENEDNASYDDDDNIENNHTDNAVSLNNKKTTGKRKHLEFLSDSDDNFDPNLPSTSRLAAAANITSTKSSSSSKSLKVPVKNFLRLDPPSEEVPFAQIKIENNTDAIKYLQHIKNYLLSQNDEVGVKLLLNLQLAFIDFN